jgi:ribonuclease HI
MERSELSKIFDRVPADTKRLLTTEVINELSAVILNVSNKLKSAGITLGQLRPDISRMLGGLHFIEIDKPDSVRVIVVLPPGPMCSIKYAEICSYAYHGVCILPSELMWDPTATLDFTEDWAEFINAGILMLLRRFPRASLIDIRGVNPAEVSHELARVCPRVTIYDDTQYIFPGNNVLWLFTDGGSLNNGKSNCKSSWGWCVTNGRSTISDSGLVENTSIIGEKYQSSNNRGELTAILNGLKYSTSRKDLKDYSSIIVVSDSEYCIKSISIWCINWFREPEKHNLSSKKNIDLIKPARNIIDDCPTAISFQHIRSHKRTPMVNSVEYSMWYFNDLVDKLCSAELKI